MRILCYHAFTDFGDESSFREYGISPEQLAAQLGAMGRWGFEFVGPAELADRIEGRSPVGSREIAITIDDAYADVLDAEPVFADHGVEPVLFAVSSKLGGASDWMPEPHLALLDGAQLAGLAERGWEIGSHSRSHPFLTSLDDAALGDELEGSRHELANAGIDNPRWLAYPHGLHDERVRAAARAAGYEAGFALESSTVDTTPADPMYVQRIEVLRSHSLAQLRLMLALPGSSLRHVQQARTLGRRAFGKAKRTLMSG